MTSVLAVSEGFVPFKGYRTWYRIVGDLDQSQAGTFPLLMVHGRPCTNLSLTPFEKLAETGRGVVMYDQLGCGHSDRPDDPSLWTIEHFVEEVSVVRRELGLKRTHLLGHSWGGVVAMEYASTKPSGIVSLILASTYPSRPMFIAEVERLRGELPKDVQDTLRKHEETGTTDDPDYQAAERVFDLRHVCSVDPWPEYLETPPELQPVGTVNRDNWDIRPRLSGIDIPTLVTCGRYDMCSPDQARIIHDGIRGSELVVFEDSSHFPHVEETGGYLAAVSGFLTCICR